MADSTESACYYLGLKAPSAVVASAGLLMDDTAAIISAPHRPSAAIRSAWIPAPSSSIMKGSGVSGAAGLCGVE